MRITQKHLFGMILRLNATHFEGNLYHSALTTRCSHTSICAFYSLMKLNLEIQNQLISLLLHIILRNE